MARFTFSKTRKKPLPQVAPAEPINKAHRVLGSTPMSIDSPKTWDDGSSSFSATTASTGPSYATEDSTSDHHVTIVRSDWDDEADALPPLLEASIMDDVSDYEGSDPHASALRKSHSSSTIKSWYDKSKPSLSSSHSASSLNMVGGVPPKVQRLLDVKNGVPVLTPKKKPPMLDFSALTGKHSVDRKGSVPSIPADGALSGIFSPGSNSPSANSFKSSMMDRREPRKIQKRRTGDGSQSIQSPIVEEMQRPRTAGKQGDTRVFKDVPNLFEHYEQMAMVQVPDEDPQDDTWSTESLSPGAPNSTSLDDDDINLDRIEEETQNTTSRNSSSSRLFSTSIDRSKSTLSTRSYVKQKENGLDDAAIQEKSVLMLSESESEDDIGPLRDFATFRPSHSSVSSNGTVVYDPQSQASRASSSSQTMNYRTSRSSRTSRCSKRTSFVPAHTYPSNSNSDNGVGDPRVVSMAARPDRESVMSNFSTMSGMTLQSIHEAKAVRVVPVVRQPSRVNVDAESSNDSSTVAATKTNNTTDLSLHKRQPQIAPSSSISELTPPLSPASGTFHSRTGRGSIDIMGSTNRLMAVTREEEMLLSKLREQNQQDQDVSAVKEYLNQGESTMSKPLDDKEGLQEIEAFVADAMFDFGFPAPPTARKESFSNILQNRLSNRIQKPVGNGNLSQAKNALVSTNTESVITPTPVPNSPPCQSPKGILKRPEEALTMDLNIRNAVSHSEDDDDELGLDANDFSEFGYLASHSINNDGPSEEQLSIPQPERSSFGQPLTKLAFSPSDERKASSLQSTQQPPQDLRGMTPVIEDSETDEDANAEVAPPDSPVAPESFPAVPRIRTTISSKARLSAVGPLLPNEPGWWGDDD